MIPRRSSPMPGGAANATSTSTIAGVAYCGDVPSTIAALCPMFAFLAVCVVISTISITGGFDAHPLPSLSNSTTSTPSSSSSSSSVSGQNEFATFLGWYLFLLACCIFPTACAYHKCRRSVSDVAEYDERRRGGEWRGVGGVGGTNDAIADGTTTRYYEFLDDATNRDLGWDALGELFANRREYAVLLVALRRCSLRVEETNLIVACHKSEGEGRPRSGRNENDHDEIGGIGGAGRGVMEDGNIGDVESGGEMMDRPVRASIDDDGRGDIDLENGVIGVDGGDAVSGEPRADHALECEDVEDDDDNDDNDDNDEEEDDVYSALCLPCDETSSVNDGASSSSTRCVPPTCAICLLQYRPGNYVTWSSNRECIHVFHRDCVLMWLLKKDDEGRRNLRGERDRRHFCPCCRGEFVSDTLMVELIMADNVVDCGGMGGGGTNDNRHPEAIGEGGGGNDAVVVDPPPRAAEPWLFPGGIAVAMHIRQQIRIQMLQQQQRSM